MDKENSAPRVLAAAHASKLSGAKGRAGGTARAARPALGRDTAPALLRLGRPEHVPCLRFDDQRAGVGKTLPLRVQNDTPHVQEARFERINRDDGFMVDPDRVALPPGASHVVRVSWCPSKASRHAHNSEMLVTLDDGEGDAGRMRRGKKMSLAVRVRASAVAPAEKKKRLRQVKTRRAVVHVPRAREGKSRRERERERDRNARAADRKTKTNVCADVSRRARGQDAQADTDAGSGSGAARIA
jgi:hypothetical protein